MTLEEQILAKADELAAASGCSREEALDGLRSALIGERKPIRTVITREGRVLDLNEEEEE